MENSFDPGILKKMRVGKTSKILIMNSPEGYLSLFASMDYDSILNPENSGKYDFVQVFGSGRLELEKQILKVKEAGKYDCLFWACYPKSIGKERYDLKRETVWSALGLAGLRPVSQIAIDEKWTALRGRDPELVGK